MKNNTELHRQAKELKDKESFRQYRSNQGRSPEREENIYKGCFWIVLLFGIVLSLYGIYNIIT